MHLILFIVFAGFCLAGAINLLLQSHPISSALSLIVVMTSLAVLYLLLGAEFLAAAQVIVYAGAIMVLFVFVVMLLNAGREERTLGSRAAAIVGFPAVVAILGVIATMVLHMQGLEKGLGQEFIVGFAGSLFDDECQKSIVGIGIFEMMSGGSVNNLVVMLNDVLQQIFIGQVFSFIPT